MADVTAIFGVLIFLGLSIPGYLTLLWLLFPATVARAQVRLEHTPWRCFWLGGVLTALFTIPIVVLLALPFGPAQLAGASLWVLALALAGVGVAGLVAKMAAQWRAPQAGRISPASAFVRSALVLELGVAVPVIGWFVVLPLVTVTGLGAAAFALLRWMPHPLAAPRPAESPSTVVA